MSISFNINAEEVPNRVALIEWHRRARPAWSLVMNDNGHRSLLKDLAMVSPGTEYIHRDYNTYGGDDGLHKKIKPADWVRAQYAMLGGRFWAYAGNEPEFNDELINWTAAVALEAVRLKQPTVLLNLAVGNPKNVDAWWRAEPVLRLACSNPEYLAIGLHEYAVGVPTSGFVGGAPNGLDEHGNEIHPDWTKPAQWPANVQQFGMLWHCGRFRKVLDYCKQFGWNKPRIVITEHGFDNVSDIDWWRKSLPVAPGFSDLRGWKSHEAYWRSLEPNWSAEQFYAQALTYLDKTVYLPAGVEGQLIFTWTNNPQWKRNFDVSGAGVLLDTLAVYNQAQNPPLPPAPEPEPNPEPEPTPEPPQEPPSNETPDDDIIWHKDDLNALATLWAAFEAYADSVYNTELARIAREFRQIYAEKGK